MPLTLPAPRRQPHAELPPATATARSTGVLGSGSRLRQRATAGVRRPRGQISGAGGPGPWRAAGDGLRRCGRGAPGASGKQWGAAAGAPT